MVLDLRLTAIAYIAYDQLPCHGHEVRSPLTRDRIVATALLILEERGLSGLTMRELGNALDVEAMSLYRYVPGREELLDAVVERVLEPLWHDVDVRREPVDGWQDFLVRLAHGVRRIAVTHPQAFPLVASRPPEAPWLRPPLRSVAWVELFLSAMVESGFDDRSAADAYRSFTSFLLGTLLLEVAEAGVKITPADNPSLQHAGLGADVPADRFPTVRRLKNELERDDVNQEFDEALEDLVDRISRRMPSTRADD